MLQRDFSECADVAESLPPKAAYKVGVSTRNDLLQVDLKKNELESTSLELNSYVDVLRMLLAQYIGFKDYDRFDIPDFNSAISAVSPESLLVAPDSALS